MSDSTKVEPFELDVDAYLQRIGYTGSREPTIETLNGIAFAHVTTVPFEDCDVLLRREFHVNPSACFNKIVRNRRGGYCFEQNCLLHTLLTALGFDAKIVFGRVTYMRPPDAPLGPRVHSVMIVTIDDEEFLLDVAFGANAPACALRMVSDLVQDTPHEPHRIRASEYNGQPVYFHDVKLEDKWGPMHQFDRYAVLPCDLEMHHWYTATHPDNSLYNRLVVTLAKPDGRRLILVNRDFKTRHPDGRLEVQPIASADELLQLLREHFGIDFPPGTRFAEPKFE